MKLVTRIFLSFFLVIFLAIFASAVIGSLLISNAVKSEAVSRIRAGLKEARGFLEDRQDDLLLAALIESEGLSARVPPLNAPDILTSIPDPLPAFLRQEGTDGPVPDRGYIMLDKDTVLRLNPGLEEITSNSVCPEGKILCIYALHSTAGGAVFAASVLNDNTDLISGMQDMLFENRNYQGKPFGTVTIFCGNTRAATTVLGPGGTRARARPSRRRSGKRS